MKIKICLSLSILIIFSVSVFGQTANDFEKKYGSQIYYEIRPRILMSAEYDNNSQVCKVSFQPNQLSKKSNTTFIGQDKLDLVQLKEAFDEIVPIENRQGMLKTNGGYNISTLSNMYYGKLDYENISIKVVGSLGLKGKSVEGIEFCKIFGNGKKDNNKFNFFGCTSSGTLATVIINWKNRDCSKN